MHTPNSPNIHRVRVSRKALVARVNRRLKHHGKCGHLLRATRSERWRHDLGDHYTIDVATSVIIDQHIDLEDLARDIGALASYECLDDEATS